MSLIERPPIGFVVEGHGEYYCYPSLCARIMGCHLHVPRANAIGCGSISRNLHEHLTDLCIASHPLHVIVTVDLKDLIDQSLFRDCVDACTTLKSMADEWMERARSDKRIDPMPDSITIVVQIHKFESWFLADIEALKAAGYLIKDAVEFNDVESFSGDPYSYLMSHMCSGGDLKSPDTAKELISVIRPDHMRSNSRSFDKFFREVRRSFEDWTAQVSLG